MPQCRPIPHTLRPLLPEPLLYTMQMIDACKSRRPAPATPTTPEHNPSVLRTTKNLTPANPIFHRQNLIQLPQNQQHPQNTPATANWLRFSEFHHCGAIATLNLSRFAARLKAASPAGEDQQAQHMLLTAGITRFLNRSSDPVKPIPPPDAPIGGEEINDWRARP
jgi:hypothetical protein